MTTEPTNAETLRDRRRKSWPVILAVIGYMVPLFWLWHQTGFPDDLGVNITAHGKTGLLENWWYSYLLLQRHRIVDVVTFAYMWAAVAGAVAWLGWAVVKDCRAKQMSGSIDSTNEKGDAA